MLDVIDFYFVMLSISVFNGGDNFCCSLGKLLALAYGEGRGAIVG